MKGSQSYMLSLGKRQHSDRSGHSFNACSSTYLSFTFMENKDPLCLFNIISKVICIGFIMARAPENPSHVPCVGHSPLCQSAKPLSALHLNLCRRFCKPYKEGVFIPQFLFSVSVLDALSSKTICSMLLAQKNEK